mmetsp:Transcript_37649/g.117735  ORF Transcript_37649/g.117735 Transcript_37649/m.117735 type:complete len:291 (+) Transcript_37649:548-1420(+)
MRRRGDDLVAEARVDAGVLIDATNAAHRAEAAAAEATHGAVAPQAAPHVTHRAEFRIHVAPDDAHCARRAARLGCVVTLLERQQVAVDGVSVAEVARALQELHGLARLNRLLEARVVHPVGHAAHLVRHQNGAAMHELGVLVNLGGESAVEQVVHPGGDGLAVLELELHLEDRVREARDIMGRHLRLRVAEPAPRRRHVHGVVRALGHHREVRVQGDAHRRVEGDLEGRAITLRAHRRYQLLTRNRLVDLARELLPRFHLCILLAACAHGDRFLLDVECPVEKFLYSRGG